MRNGYGPLLGLAVLSACTLVRPPPPVKTGATGAPSAVAQPAPTAGSSTEADNAAPPVHIAPPARSYHLSPASSALVSQAHREAGAGEVDQAAATLERALGIEPDNPLLWVELGRVRLEAGNAGQANAMGRKALSLAGGDPAAQAAAWRLIADALRAQGRISEAYEADRRAETLVTH